MRIAITGAAGKTGRAVTAAVRGLGAAAIPVVHRPHGIDGERIADLNDAAAMSLALAEADAVYLIAPNAHSAELDLLRPTIDLCEQAELRVVYHSVMHPHAPRMPHHMDKADVEAALHESSLVWSVLQPASYMDNVLVPVSSSGDGVWRQPYDVSTLFTPVALEDVAAAAALVLTDPSHAYATYELAGPTRLSTVEMAAILQRTLDRPLTAVADRDGWERLAEGLLEAESHRRLGMMFDYYDVHGFVGNSHILEWLLGCQPVTFEEWVRRHRRQLLR